MVDSCCPTEDIRVVTAAAVTQTDLFGRESALGDVGGGSKILGWRSTISTRNEQLEKSTAK